VQERLLSLMSCRELVVHVALPVCLRGVAGDAALSPRILKLSPPKATADEKYSIFVLCFNKVASWLLMMKLSSDGMIGMSHHEAPVNIAPR